MLDLIFEWIVAIHYNAYVTVRDFVVSQAAILVALAGFLWMAKVIYEDKERYARPKRRLL